MSSTFDKIGDVMDNEVPMTYEEEQEALAQDEAARNMTFRSFSMSADNGTDYCTISEELVSLGRAVDIKRNTSCHVDLVDHRCYPSGSKRDCIRVKAVYNPVNEETIWKVYRLSDSWDSREDELLFAGTFNALLRRLKGE